MIAFLLCMGAFTAGCFLFWSYLDGEAQKKTQSSAAASAPDHGESMSRFKIFADDITPGEDIDPKAIEDRYTTVEEVSAAIRKAGVEQSNLIIGVDFSASNEWQGRKVFGGRSLHEVSGNRVYNPYQRVLSSVSQTLESFTECKRIYIFGFGDANTKESAVFAFKETEQPCYGFDDVLAVYNNVAKRARLSGPTSFAPIIRKSIEMVQKRNLYHVLLILTDGQIKDDNATATVAAIVEASKHPMSIIVVGVGDGPWNVMRQYDDCLPARQFDNFQFVDFHSIVAKCRYPDAGIALHCLMEIPDQYKAICDLGLLDVAKVTAEDDEEQTEEFTN